MNANGVRALMLTCGLLGATEAAAQHCKQDAESDKLTLPAPFEERPHFSPLAPTGKHLLFEGSVTASYFFINCLTDPEWQSEGGWKFSWPLTMTFVVRMSRTRSSPVLTPSYRPKILDLQYFRLWRPDSVDTTMVDIERRKHFKLLYVGTGLTHYSNGQSGCRFLGFELDTVGTPPADTVRCVPSGDGTLAARRVANTENGDFSTDYLPLTVRFRWGKMRGLGLSRVDWQATVGAELQIHPLGGWFFGSLDGDQALSWGMHQWSLNAEFEKRVGANQSRLRGVRRIAVEYIERFGGGIPQHRRAGQLELSYVFDRIEHVGGFIRGHSGFDYYNMQWQDSHPFMSVGVMWDVGRFDRMKTR